MLSAAHTPHLDPAVEAQRQEALHLLADIAVDDPLAALMAELVLTYRMEGHGDLAEWVEVLRRAKLSLLGAFGKTRLLHIAVSELRKLVPPVREGALLDLAPWRALMPDPTRTTLTYQEVMTANDNGWWRVLALMPGQEADCTPAWDNPREWIYDMQRGAWRRADGREGV